MRKTKRHINNIHDLAEGLRYLAANMTGNTQNGSNSKADAGPKWDIGLLFCRIFEFIEFHRSPDHARTFLGRFLRLNELDDEKNKYSKSSRKRDIIFQRLNAFLDYRVEIANLKRYLRWLASMYEREWKGESRFKISREHQATAQHLVKHPAIERLLNLMSLDVSEVDEITLAEASREFGNGHQQKSTIAANKEEPVIGTASREKTILESDTTITLLVFANKLGLTKRAITKAMGANEDAPKPQIKAVKSGQKHFYSWNAMRQYGIKYWNIDIGKPPKNIAG